MTAQARGYWREMNPAAQPVALVRAGLGALPMQHEGRWYARQPGLAGRPMRALYFAGLGDASSDLASANALLAAGGALVTQGLDTSKSDSDRDTLQQQAVDQFLAAAQGYQTVAADVGQSTLVDSYVSTIQTIKGSLNGDLTADAANAANAQAAAVTAQQLVTPLVTSSKGANAGGTQTQGGGTQSGTVVCPQGTVNAGQTVSNLSQCGGSTAVTTRAATTTSSWWPWAIAAGVGVGAIAIAVAMHKKKRGKLGKK